LTHNVCKKNKLKQTNASTNLVRSKFRIREGSPTFSQKDYVDRICERDEF